jgi:pectate lyase
MRENVQHKNRLDSIVNSRNQPKLVAGDIEYRSASNLIGVGINLLHVNQRIPVSPPHDLIPTFQAGTRIWMPANELHYGLPADYPHEKRYSQKEN